MHSMFTATVGITIYKFMALADVGYLDLSSPVNMPVLCLDRWPLRHQTESWWTKELWVDWVRTRSDMAGYIEEHRCAATSVGNATACRNVVLPLLDLQRNLGMPFTTSFKYRNDTLEMYSHLFLYMTVWLWVSILVHDMTLLSNTNKDYILDFIGVKKRFPCLQKMYLLTGFFLLRGLVKGKACRGTTCEGSSRWVCLGRAAALLLVPILLAWTLLVFIVILWPVSMLFFICYPIRLSRALIFVLCIALGVFGISLTLHMMTFLCSPTMRPIYAVTWVVDASASCFCGCHYPLSQAGCMQILFIGFIMTFQSLMLGFRCLKGLRRNNWANLMSVTFAVPLTLYAVEWTQPDGRPIRFRKESEPVQGEPAFDPFAMMDEQPESKWTTVCLKPVPLQGRAIEGMDGAARKLRFEGPTLRTCNLNEVDEVIGCCGFPCRKSARRPPPPSPSCSSGSCGAAEAALEDPAGADEENPVAVFDPAEDDANDVGGGEGTAEAIRVATVASGAEDRHRRAPSAEEKEEDEEEERSSGVQQQRSPGLEATIEEGRRESGAYSD